MKLYATVTSERASKGQGGEWLNIVITDCNKKVVGKVDIKPFKDSVGDGLEARVEFDPRVYVNGENEFHFGRLSEVMTKGEKQKGEKCKKGYAICLRDALGRCMD